MSQNSDRGETEEQFSINRRRTLKGLGATVAGLGALKNVGVVSADGKENVPSPLAVTPEPPQWYNKKLAKQSRGDGNQNPQQAVGKPDLSDLPPFWQQYGRNYLGSGFLLANEARMQKVDHVAGAGRISPDSFKVASSTPHIRIYLTKKKYNNYGWQGVNECGEWMSFSLGSTSLDGNYKITGATKSKYLYDQTTSDRKTAISNFQNWLQNNGYESEADKHLLLCNSLKDADGIAEVGGNVALSEHGPSTYKDPINCLGSTYYIWGAKDMHYWMRVAMQETTHMFGVDEDKHTPGWRCPDNSRPYDVLYYSIHFEQEDTTNCKDHYDSSDVESSTTIYNGNAPEGGPCDTIEHLPHSTRTDVYYSDYNDVSESTAKNNEDDEYGPATEKDCSS